jgi:hypothetical protein
VLFQSNLHVSLPALFSNKRATAVRYTASAEDLYPARREPRLLIQGQRDEARFEFSSASLSG